jgi:uncharacterized protein YlxP (DUF503 family)
MSGNDGLKENIEQLKILKNKLSDIKNSLTNQKSQLSGLQQDQKKCQEEKQRLIQQLSEVSQKLSKCNEQEKPLFEGQKQRIVQEQALATDRETAIKTRISSLEENIQGVGREQTELLIQQQKSLKNTFFRMRQTLDQYVVTPQPLIRFLLLQSLKDKVNQENLSPDELEDLKDRDYADDVLNRLKSTFDTSMNSITANDQKDLQNWMELQLAIISISQMVHSREDDLSSLPALLEQAKKDLDNFKRQHNDGEQKRREYRSQSTIAFVVTALALIGTIVSALNSSILGVVVSGIVFVVAFVYGIISSSKCANLDYTKNIQDSQKEYNRLENDRVNMPNTQASLEADKKLLLQKQQELSAINSRHPELSDFQLPQL